MDAMAKSRPAIRAARAKLLDLEGKWVVDITVVIANEVARLAGVVLTEYATALRKIKDSKNAPEATLDATQQLQRLMPKHFMAATPWPQLQHFARYLKAITQRLDKYRADPARDATRLTELRPQEQRFWRLVAERKGTIDARMQEYRWLLEELRVSFFAQELRTPQPVSIKRLEKAGDELGNNHNPFTFIDWLKAKEAKP